MQCKASFRQDSMRLNKHKSATDVKVTLLSLVINSTGNILMSHVYR